MLVMQRTITPRDAESLLGNNYDKNRNIRPGYVHQLANAMLEGRFNSMNGQTVVVGEDGTLLDGQHRMSAVVESGVTLDFLVVTVDDSASAFLTLDQGAVRKNADFKDVFPTRSGKAAAIAKVMACLEWGALPIATSLNGVMQNKGKSCLLADRGTVLAYASEKSEDVYRVMSIASSMAQAAKRGAITAYGGAYWLIRLVGRDELLDDFVADYVNEAPDSKTVAVFKHRVSTAGAINRTVLAAKTLEAYEHFRLMDESTMLNGARHYLAKYDALLKEWRKEHPHG